jgi:hypothetical protein
MKDKIKDFVLCLLVDKIYKLSFFQYFDKVFSNFIFQLTYSYFKIALANNEIEIYKQLAILSGIKEAV